MLVKIITWSNGDKAQVVDEIHDTFIYFTKYVGKAKETPAEKDSAVLLSYVQSCMHNLVRL